MTAREANINDARAGAMAAYRLDDDIADAINEYRDHIESLTGVRPSVSSLSAALVREALQARGFGKESK